MQSGPWLILFPAGVVPLPRLYKESRRPIFSASVRLSIIARSASSVNGRNDKASYSIRGVSAASNHASLAPTTWGASLTPKQVSCGRSRTVATRLTTCPIKHSVPGAEICIQPYPWVAALASVTIQRIGRRSLWNVQTISRGTNMGST